MRNFYLSLGIAVLMGTAICQANDTGKLIVTSKSGAAKEFDLTKIGKVTFNNNHLVMMMADGTKESLSIKDIHKMTFDLSISTNYIEKVEGEAGKDLHVALENNIMTITERNGNEINVAVYSTNGALLLNTKGLGTLQVDFAGLNPGIYIIKANDKLIKYIR